MDNFQYLTLNFLQIIYGQWEDVKFHISLLRVARQGLERNGNFLDFPDYHSWDSMIQLSSQIDNDNSHNLLNKPD